MDPSDPPQRLVALYKQGGSNFIATFSIGSQTVNGCGDAPLGRNRVEVILKQGQAKANDLVCEFTRTPPQHSGADLARDGRHRGAGIARLRLLGHARSELLEHIGSFVHEGVGRPFKVLPESRPAPVELRDRAG